MDLTAVHSSGPRKCFRILCCVLAASHGTVHMLRNSMSVTATAWRQAGKAMHEVGTSTCQRSVREQAAEAVGQALQQAKLSLATAANRVGQRLEHVDWVGMRKQGVRVMGRCAVLSYWFFPLL